MKLSSIAFLGALGLALPAPLPSQEAVPTPPEAGWIGIRFDISGSGAPGVTDERFAIVVTDTYRGGPADAGGLHPGDRVIEVNGVRLASYDGWMRALSSVTPGETMRIKLLRSGTERDVTIIAGQRPQSVQPALSLDIYFSTGARLARNADSLIQTVAEAAWGGWDEPPSIPWASEVVVRGPGGMDSVAWQVTFGATVAIDWADASERLLAFERIVQDNAQRYQEALQQFRAAEEEMRLLEETFEPPAAGGGGPDTTPIDAGYTRQPRLLLTPNIVGSPVVLGGALVRDLGADLGRYFGLGAGVLITDVVPGGPAEKSGLRPGDVIVSVGDKEVTTVTELRVDLADVMMPVELTIIRQRNQVKLSYPGR